MGKSCGPALLQEHPVPAQRSVRCLLSIGVWFVSHLAYSTPFLKKQSEFNICNQVTIFDKTVCQNASLSVSVMQFFDH